MNFVTIVGRIISIKTVTNKISMQISVKRSYKNVDGVYETDIIPCITRMDGYEHYLKKDCVIGIKGRLERQNKKLVVVAERVTILVEKKEGEKNGRKETNES